MKRILTLALVVCAAVCAQTSVGLMPAPKQQYFDDNGYPLAGGLIYFCVAGSTCPGTPLDTYTDATGTTKNPNPVVLDAAGRAAIWPMTGTSYKIVAANSLGVVLWTADKVAVSNSSRFVAITATATDAAAGVVPLRVEEWINTFPSNGTLGPIYGQRVNSWTGGAAGDSSAPVQSAVRGYNQIGTGVTYDVETGHMGVVDNLSYLAQGVGTFGQANSWHAGRAWGGVFEAHELGETFTATAGQTTFPIPNGFAAGASVVTKNGTLLTSGSQYTEAGGNVILTSGAAAGDTVKVWRGNPALGVIGTEIDVYAGNGPDTANAATGNRIGSAIFGYRHDKTVNVDSHIGTMQALFCDAADSWLTCDRGFYASGKYGAVVDLTAASPVSWYLKLSSTAGITAAGNLALGNVGTLDTAGFGTMNLGKSTNGGIYRVGDGTHWGRLAASTASGVTVGSETAIDLILLRNSAEVARLTATGLLMNTAQTVTVPSIKSTTGTRYVCVDTAGKLVSQAAACSGT